MPEAPIKVLLVEDNPGDARLVRLALATSRAVRFEVRLVASMTEALKVIATDSFDIVLLDLSARLSVAGDRGSSQCRNRADSYRGADRPRR